MYRLDVKTNRSYPPISRYNEILKIYEHDTLDNLSFEFSRYGESAAYIRVSFSKNNELYHQRYDFKNFSFSYISSHPDRLKITDITFKDKCDYLKGFKVTIEDNPTKIDLKDENGRYSVIVTPERFTNKQTIEFVPGDYQ
jgi:hypothetical protein